MGSIGPSNSLNLREIWSIVIFSVPKILRRSEKNFIALLYFFKVQVIIDNISIFFILKFVEFNVFPNGSKDLNSCAVVNTQNVSKFRFKLKYEINFG